MYQLLVIVISLILSCTFTFSFDYYKLVLQWPATYCKGQNRPCNIPYPTTFTIHGLWPSNFAAFNPSMCTGGTKFPQNIPSHLQSQLASQWPNLNGKDEDFWKWEWFKHGTCSAFPKQPLAYFTQALQINGMIGDLKAHLAAAHIVPGATALYDRDLVRDAIKSKTGKYPQLSCKMNPLRPPQPPHAPHYTDLAEIRVCLDLNIAYRDCPVLYAALRCTQMIYWPV